MLETELMTALDFLSLPENMKVARKQFIEHFGEQTHHRLKAANYIKTCTLGDPFGVWIDAVTITVLGTQVLLATKQSNEAKGLRKNDTRRSWWQFVLGLFLGWILGGILPQDVWNTIRNWFGIAHP